MTTRPELPLSYRNLRIPILVGSPENLPPVKYQILNSNGIDVLVGRLKIETSLSGHAFILRRFDTMAISATTMFKAAFPKATPQHENTEMAWLKSAYSTDRNNGSKTDATIPRLAGTWLSPADALLLASEYDISEIVQIIANAVPDASMNYRRSKGAATSPAKVAPATPVAPNVTNGTTSIVPSTLPPLTTSHSSPIGPTPAKRRKEASPVPAPQPSIKAPRRSMRATKSPPPSRSHTIASAATHLRSRTPTRASKYAAQQPPTPIAGSDETAVDEETDAVVDAAARGELHKQDVAEQQELISKLKAQRTDNMVVTEKREREEDEAPLTLNFKEPESGDRIIASNRRVRLNLDTRQKSVAWGIAAFAVSFGAITYLPGLL